MDEQITGTLNITDETGHTAVRWNRNDPKSVAEAKGKFDSAVATRSRVAFRTKPDSKKITEFDPNAEEITLINQYKGG